MNIERVTWMALSGALFTVFWPWTVMQAVVSVACQPGDRDDQAEAD